MSPVSVSRQRPAEGHAMPVNNDPMSDATDLKTEVHSTHQRIDALRDRMDQNTTFLIQRMDNMQAELRKEITSSVAALRTEVGGLRSEMTGSVAALRTEVGGLRSEITGSVAALRTEVGGLRSEMAGSMAELRKGIESVDKSLGAAKIWAMTLCYTLVGAILIVIARGLKWL